MAYKLKEEKKRKPLGDMILKAYNKDIAAQAEKDPDKKAKLQDQARLIHMAAYESVEPLEELFDLFEAEVMNPPQPKPSVNTEPSSAYEGPNNDDYQHPVIRKRNMVDAAREGGMNAADAHQSVHGDVNLSDSSSKSEFAATLGRVQDDNDKRDVTIEKDKNSILAQDSKLEAQADQVTRDDLRSPMRQQVPDKLQTPPEEVAEELEKDEDYDYNLDVAYLQKYGRA